jgi:hypothetical protein
VASPWPQFEFGADATAGNITMQGFIFDGYILGQQGIVQARDCHDITLNDMVVRNSRCDGTYANPYQSWAIYLLSDATARPTNFTANRWIIEDSARQMSALQVYGSSHVTASGWVVTGAKVAVYAGNDRGPITDLILDDWTITDTGGAGWGRGVVAVEMQNASGRFSNIHLIASGILENIGIPTMVDGGGNSL